MGWRAWDHYESEARARWKALPWRERYDWRSLLVVIAIAVAAVAFFYASIARGAPIGTSDVHVIDGDTIRVFHKGPNVRLVGFNTPETRRATCQGEREFGDQATRRLRDLVRTDRLDFEFVRCACPPGTEGTQACNHKRRCGTLKANGRDVGEILIAENLAVPFECGETRCPPTPKPWCSGR